VSPHHQRHSFATDMLRAGTEIVLVSELFGHASLNSTRIYTNSTANRGRHSIGRRTTGFA
jgi:integrase/recombinase XerC